MGNSMKKVKSILTLILSLLTTATPAQKSLYEEMGRRDYYEWHRIMCEIQSESYGKYLVASSKAVNEIVKTTAPNSYERKVLLDEYKSIVRQRLENLRKINYGRTTSPDQLERIHGKWSNALYATALTYPLEHSGEIFEYEAREILFRECMGDESISR